MAPAWLTMAGLAAAVGVLALGAVMACASANAGKRLAGMQIAMLGACLALAALDAPGVFALSAIAVSAAQLALGVAIIVRLQEGYGGVEAPDIDVADKEQEQAEVER
jgi:NADH:ubiquinone oxidoreductase subunit K